MRMNLPNDWKLSKLSEVATVKGGKRLPKGYELISTNNGHPYITVSDMKNGSVNLDTIKYAPDVVYNKIKNYTISCKDIYITVVGSTLGSIGIVPKELDGALLTENADKITDIKINQMYLLYMLESEHFQTIISNERTVNAQPKLAISKINNFEIPIPPLPEQEKIASILSTWDKAIELKEKLIVEKKKQKKGLMQKLLTSEVRVPGFDGEWKEVRLSEVSDLIHGYQFRTEDFTSNGIPIIKIGNVKGYRLDLTDITYIDKSRLGEFQNIVIKNGDLLMSLTGNIGRVVEVTGLDEPVLQNYRVGKFVTISDVLTKQFLKHMLSSDILFNQFNGLANQSAQANFGKQDMDKLFIEIPLDIGEQIAIATILSTADKEINLLEQELEALKLQKKGLMQLLLTGIVRVNTEN